MTVMAKARGFRAATESIRNVKATNALAFVLIGLLILGLAGFGIGNFSGNVSPIGSVGDEDIPVDEYGRILNAELQNVRSQTGENLSFTEASVYGVEQRALERAIFFTTLDNESNEIGLSVGDETILRRLLESDQFNGLDGVFDRETYEFVLERLGLRAAEYEELMRDEAARELLQMAVTSAVQPSSHFARILLEYIQERRSFSWIEVTSDMLEVPESSWTESALQKYYESNPERFTLPERRKITFAWVIPEMLAETVVIDEGDLRELYDERIDIYQAPERRVVDRLVFPDDEAAIEAELRLRSGIIEFGDLLEERGVLLADIDLGVVERGDLLPKAADAVFAATDLGIVGPVQSDLGPAIFRLNAVLKADVSFEGAREDLKEEITNSQARRLISDNVSVYEDLLAGGATLEQLAAETAMQLGTITYSNNSPFEGIAQQREFRSAAQTIETEDFPELLDLSDGGVFALRLDNLREPQLQPLNEVRTEAAVLLEAELIGQQLRDLGESIRADLISGKNFGDLDLFPFVEKEKTRTGFALAAPGQLVSEVFKLEAGDVLVHQHENRVAVARLDEVLPVDVEAPGFRATLDNVDAEIAASIGNDAFVLFVTQLRRSAGLELNQAVINAVHSQFQ